MKDFLSWIEEEKQKADQNLSTIPDKENLKLCAAFVPIRKLNNAKEVFNQYLEYVKFTNTK